MMIDHVSLGVTDRERSKAFYDAALRPLGYTRIMEFPEGVGYGADQKPAFWIGVPESAKVSAGPGTHVAFVAPSRAAVTAFYDAALKAGGRDNGKPGLRPEYHPDYFGAFVIDPSGHHVEACCHRPE